MSLTRNGLTVLGPTRRRPARRHRRRRAGRWPSTRRRGCSRRCCSSRSRSRAPRRAPRGPSTIADLREGWTFFRSTTWLWAVVLGFGFLNMIHTGAIFALGPVVAEDTIGRQGWGYVLSAEALGLLADGRGPAAGSAQRPLFWGMISVALACRCRWSCSASTRTSWRSCARPSSPVPASRSSPWAGTSPCRRTSTTGCSRAPTPTTPSAPSSRCPSASSRSGPLGAAFGNSRVLVISGIAYAAICLLVLTSRSVRDLPRRTAAEDDCSTPLVEQCRAQRGTCRKPRPQRSLESRDDHS